MLKRLQDKLEELQSIRPRACDDVFHIDGDYDFKAYEVSRAAHDYDIECVQLVIDKLERAIKIRRGMELLNGDDHIDLPEYSSDDLQMYTWLKSNGHTDVLDAMARHYVNNKNLSTRELFDHIDSTLYVDYLAEMDLPF